MPKVVFIRDGGVGRLIIDGLTVLEDRAQAGNVSWHVSSPIYVGGVPPGAAQKNIQVGLTHQSDSSECPCRYVSDFLPRSMPVSNYPRLSLH